jgi:glycine/D-amino acid oxidase-like deaminating enzyme
MARSRNAGLQVGRRSSATAVVAGAGAAGVFCALALRRRGLTVSLLDPSQPGHLRGASGGYHRILRSSHGGDAFYTAWSRSARTRWLELEQETGAQLLVQSGFVALASARDDRWEAASADTLERLEIPHAMIAPDELAARLPVASLDGIAYGLWEPEAGFLHAQRAVIAAVRRFSDLGGTVVRAGIATDRAERPTLDGRPIEADVVVCACGAWMGELFPGTLRPILRVVRQDAILVAPPAGSTAYDAEQFPSFMDRGHHAYGVPATGGLGFKAAIVWTDLAIDLESDDRLLSAVTLEATRNYLSIRFPQLAGRPVVGQEVGQIAQTPDANFVVAPHPEHSSTLLVGGDSGHLFKHAPTLGEHVADLALGVAEPEPRFAISRRTTLSRAESPQ